MRVSSPHRVERPSLASTAHLGVEAFSFLAFRELGRLSQKETPGSLRMPRVAPMPVVGLVNFSPLYFPSKPCWCRIRARTIHAGKGNVGKP